MPVQYVSNHLLKKGYGRHYFATLLNYLYIKNLNELLNRKEITIDKIMSNLDKDLKKVFELPFLFKN